MFQRLLSPPRPDRRGTHGVFDLDRILNREFVGLAGPTGPRAHYGAQKCDQTASDLAGPMPLTLSSCERLENG